MPNLLHLMSFTIILVLPPHHAICLKTSSEQVKARYHLRCMPVFSIPMLHVPRSVHYSENEISSDFEFSILEIDTHYVDVRTYHNGSLSTAFNFGNKISAFLSHLNYHFVLIKMVINIEVHWNQFYSHWLCLSSLVILPETGYPR